MLPELKNCYFARLKKSLYANILTVSPLCGHGDGRL